MTDPLGRTGYALAPAGQDPNPVPRNFNPLWVILIDPQTGSLLATEDLGPMPRTLRCLSFDSHNRCAGSVYQGRSYPSQDDDFVAVVSESWTDATPTPPPPSRWTPNIGFPGLPRSRKPGRGCYSGPPGLNASAFSSPSSLQPRS